MSSINSFQLIKEFFTEETLRFVLLISLVIIVSLVLSNLFYIYDALCKLNKATSEKNPFDIVLIDMQMPHMNGSGLCKRIKKTPVLKKNKNGHDDLNR